MPDHAVEVYNASGTHQIVLVCEHASAFFPDEYQQLGLSDDIATSHIAWDPGALDVALYLSKTLDAVLIAGKVSRLIYDLNRPPDSPGAMLSHSEKYAVPGNADISESEHRYRVDRYYRPFVDVVSDVLTGHPAAPALVTVHSFTPVFKGDTRDVEIGVLHDADSRLADAMLACDHQFKVRRNEPYGPDDGVTHTLQLHGLSRGFLHVMLEVRNDLITTQAACASMGDYLAQWLNQSLLKLNEAAVSEGRT